MAITIMDVAMAHNVRKNDDGSVSMEAFDELNLPFFAGCLICEASLGPSQSFPSTTGYIMCKHCIGPLGFNSVEEFDRWHSSEE